MVRFYLVPVVVDAVTGTRGPKYFRWRFGPAATFTVGWEARDYGNEPSMLFAADMSDADDATLSAMTDVTKFADDLDTQLGAQLPAMQTALEALNLPASMLVSTSTHRQTIRGIMAIFAVAQCMQGKGFNIFTAGVSLSTTLSALPVLARQALQTCATLLGYDQTGITLASTVRQMLVKIVQQASPSPMMGVTV